jgi:hypothetical protein
MAESKRYKAKAEVQFEVWIDPESEDARELTEQEVYMTV